MQLIRLTLLDGDPEGLRSVGIAGRTTVLMGCPWSRLKSLLLRPEAQRPTVYFMIGCALEGDPTAGTEVVYIGECDALADRFAHHHMQEAADWSDIFLATTTERTFNKAHARLAEHVLVSKAKTAGRITVLTKRTAAGEIDEGDSAFTNEFVSNIVTLAQTLGVTVFRPKLDLKKETSVSRSEPATAVADAVPPKFYFHYLLERFPAWMVTDGKDFVILKGSKARPDGAGIPQNIMIMRTEVRESGLLKREAGEDLETFQSDYPTTSASAAGAMVYGSACSGPTAWRHAGTRQIYRDWVANRADVGGDAEDVCPVTTAQ